MSGWVAFFFFFGSPIPIPVPPENKLWIIGFIHIKGFCRPRNRRMMMPSSSSSSSSMAAAAAKSPLPPPPFLSASPRPHSRVAFLALRPRRVPLLATPAPDATPAPAADATNPLRTLWRRTLQPLGDYGFGKRSVWEGGVGLFMVSGAALLALALAWLRGFQLRSRFRKYNTVFEFTQACGICVGTPVRIRGVTVGSVVRVDSSLRSIDALVEIEDDNIIIPRNSLVEVNQSGLLMETLIDITPKDPLPAPSVGPLHPDCAKEGLILCDRQRIKGQQGVSLDALVGIFTRLGRDMEEIGVSKSYKLAEKVASIMEEAQPLLTRVHILPHNYLHACRNAYETNSFTQICPCLAMGNEIFISQKLNREASQSELIARGLPIWRFEEDSYSNVKISAHVLNKSLIHEHSYWIK